jgi:pimeloyl-ACP methyl ester carboxylesterase
VRDPQKSRLRLHVKQYIPPRPKPLSDDELAITFIVQHGQSPGDNKGAYEPFMWDLLCQPGLPPVRAIWAMDIASAGQSFLLNQAEIGDEPHWYDSSRDIVQMVNCFQDEMRPPLVGFGQSWGCAVVAMAASSNPRLFQGIILSEPVLENGWYHVHDKSAKSLVTGGAAAPSIAKRKRHFPTRAALVEAMNRSKMWKVYDPRVVQQMIAHDYRELPDGRMELITPPVQTVSFFLRPSPPVEGFPENEDYSTRTEESNWPPGFYSAQGPVGKAALARITCPILFLWEKKATFLSDEGYRKRILTAAGAFGPRKEPIDQMNVDGGHSLPLFVPRKTAVAVSSWTQKFWQRWLDEEERRAADTPIDAQNVAPAFMKRVELAERAAMDYSKRQLKL